MKKHCSLVIVFLTLLVSVFPQKAWSQQDPPHRHCCFWINGAGLRLGAFMSMTKYHRALNWPIVAINDLFAIGNDIEVSNTLCSAFNQAWPNYMDLQQKLDDIAFGIAKNELSREHVASSVRVFTDTCFSDLGWERELSPRFESPDLGTRPLYPQSGVPGFHRETTCSQKYFYLGYSVGYAHHAFQVAAQTGLLSEEARREAETAKQDALNHICWAQDLIGSIKDVKPDSGWCVRLWHPRLPGVLPLMSTICSQGFPGRSSAQQLLSQTAQVRANIQNVLLNGNAIPRIRPCPGDLILRTQKGRSWSRPNRQGLPLRNQANLRRQLALLTPNLIGNWACNLGGTYYIKQWENRITWDGYSPNWNPSNPGRIKGTWHNRFQGWIQDNKVTIRGSWEDISDGSNRGRGTLVLNIGPAWRTINVISGQGNFFGSRTMTRVP